MKSRATMAWAAAFGDSPCCFTRGAVVKWDHAVFRITQSTNCSGNSESETQRVGHACARAGVSEGRHDFLKGDPGQRSLIVRPEGRISTSRTKGRKTIVHILKEGAIFGNSFFRGTAAFTAIASRTPCHRPL